MTLVIDGVRKVAAAGQPDTMRSTKRPVEQVVSAPRPRTSVVMGMDGVRRPVRVAPPAPLTQVAVRQHPWRPVLRMPAFRLPRLRFNLANWKRPAALASMTVVALAVSVVTVRLITQPRAVAAHAEASAATPSAPPTPTPTPQLAAEQAKLQTLLGAFVAAHHGGQFNIVVKDLSTGAEATVNPDRSYESASLYKLFVADQIYHLIDTGGLTYGAPAGGGSNNTIRGCLSLMITISDNTCGRALGSILDWGSQNPALSAQGFTETDLTTPQQTSARDVAALFEKLYGGTLDSAASNSAFLTLLKNQKVNDRLPQGLPADTVIAHKTGNLDAVVHDGGIVYGPKTNYIVVAMSGPWSEPGGAPAQIAVLSQQLWQAFEE